MAFFIYGLVIDIGRESFIKMKSNDFSVFENALNTVKHLKNYDRKRNQN